MQPAYPTPREDDADDVAWQLTTGGVVWTAGDIDGAMVWLRRAAQTAFRGGFRVRATELSWATEQLDHAIATARGSSVPSPPRRTGSPSVAPSAPPVQPRVPGKVAVAPAPPKPRMHSDNAPSFDLMAQEPEPMSGPVAGDIDWLAEAQAAKAQHPDDLTPPIAPQRTPWRPAPSEEPSVSPLAGPLPSSWTAALTGTGAARAPSPFASSAALPSYADELEPVESADPGKASEPEPLAVALPTPTPMSIAPGALIEPDPTKTPPPAVDDADGSDDDVLELSDDDVEITEFESVEAAEAGDPTALVAIPEPDSVRFSPGEHAAHVSPTVVPRAADDATHADVPAIAPLAPVAVRERSQATPAPTATAPEPAPIAIAVASDAASEADTPAPTRAGSAPPPAAPPVDVHDPLHAKLLALEAFADLPDDVRETLVAKATVTTLGADEEMPTGDLAFVVEGEAAVKLAVSDSVAKRVRAGDLVPSRGTHPRALKLDLVAATENLVVASWSHEVLESVLASCPWVVDDLKAEGDRVQALAGATLGPLGERLDEGLRMMALDGMAVRVLEPFEVVMEAGKSVPGVAVVGVGTVEVQAPGEAPRELGPGALLGASDVLGGGAASVSARAGASGAVLMFAERKAAHALVVSCPPLLELFASS